MPVKYLRYHIVLLILLMLAMVFNLMTGSVHIPFKEVVAILSDNFTGKHSWEYIVLEYRLPKLIMACVVGMSLSIAGMMMQTLFQNPMAEPYVLGISSGASLGVALCILGGGLLPVALRNYMGSQTSVTVFALAGSVTVMLIVLSISRRIQQAATLLIVGLMFSSFTSAFVNVLAYLSTAEELKKFTFWNLGSLGNISWQQIRYIVPVLLFGILIAFSLNKPLNSLLLGETYARTLGMNVKKTKFLIILSTCILIAVCTAFVGPIGFIGLAVPHITRILYRTTNHFILFFGNILTGAFLLVVCDMICQLPGEQLILPVNAVTSILGAPLVIYLLLKRKGIA